ncbi:hypothetical protein ABT348_24125 [Streptomyces olivaceus]|uniref:hypothetical protein n=1 Tax=Streptomyces olivaceus TaxID=47716 RepID=UPI00332B8DD2
MALDTQEIIDRLASHAKSLGLFDQVNKHEPKTAPGRGLTCAIWVERIDPAGTLSGLKSTTGRITFNVRISTRMQQMPQDGIDPNVVRATDALIRAYSGDFTLGGAVLAVDLLGMGGGQGMFAQAGYLRMNETSIYRSITLWVPLLVADLWAQAE